MILVPFAAQKQYCNNNGGYFRGHDGDPYAVQAQDKRQEQHGEDLEDQRPQKGDQRRGQAVSQGSKKGGAEDGESGEQERKGEDKEAAQRHVQQFLVITDKQ